MASRAANRLQSVAIGWPTLNCSKSRFGTGDFDIDASLEKIWRFTRPIEVVCLSPARSHCAGKSVRFFQKTDNRLSSAREGLGLRDFRYMNRNFGCMDIAIRAYIK